MSIIFRATIRDQNQGLGLEQPDMIGNNDDEYDAYRKRMMLAYRFRPNPLVSVTYLFSYKLNWFNLFIVEQPEKTVLLK